MTRTLAVAGVTLLTLACSDEAVEPELASTALMSVTPVDGAVDVDTNPTIEVRFDHPVVAGANALIALQLGDCPGPVVMGMWSPSSEGRVLRFEPTRPLEPGMRYTVHVGGGITDVNGNQVDLETHGPSLGGMWVTQAMVMGMGSMGMGSMVSHAGPGWLHPNGFYGLAFDFTTGGS
jgi:hypothetical protein